MVKILRKENENNLFPRFSHFCTNHAGALRKRLLLFKSIGIPHLIKYGRGHDTIGKWILLRLKRFKKRMKIFLKHWIIPIAVSTKLLKKYGLQILSKVFARWWRGLGHKPSIMIAIYLNCNVKSKRYNKMVRVQLKLNVVKYQGHWYTNVQLLT